MIYFDNAATTFMSQGVKEEIVNTDFANIDSNYNISLTFKDKLNKRKKILKKVLGLNENNFYFTSGGGEANNIALLSVMKKYKKGHFIISSIEHPSVYKTAMYLKEEGYELDVLDVDKYGYIDLENLKKLIREDTLLVSIIGVNNEIGTIQKMKEIGEIIKSKNSKTYYHIDFVQGLNHIDINFSNIKVDLLSISSHKIHGPKGVGAIYIKDGINVKSSIYGDNKYNKYIPRSFPNELVMGFLKAIEEFNKDDLYHLRELRKYFLEKLDNLENIKVNSPEDGISNILNISFIGLKAEVILNFLSDNNIYVSTGSACSSNKGDSKVLKAIKLEKKELEGSIRVSFSKYNTKKEIDTFFNVLNPFLSMLRRIK